MLQQHNPHKLVCNENIGFAIMDIMDEVVELERRVRFDPRFIILQWFSNMTETEYLKPQIKRLLKECLDEALTNYWVDNNLLVELVINDTITIPYIETSHPFRLLK